MNKFFVYDYSKLLGKMREKNLTQAELSKKIGISESTLNFSLKNKRPFKQDEMLKICKILELDLENIECYFFTKKL